MTQNTYCGMCLECLRTCPKDNVVINLRPFGADLGGARGRRLDEAFKAFIMLGSAIAYSAVMLGPWGALKSAAYAVGSAAWLSYAASFLIFIFGILPGVFLVAVRAGLALEHLKVAPRQGFVALACALVPLGLLAWIAFSLSFVFTNLSYLWPTLSDPFGWGWNLFGTARLPWTPYWTGAVSLLQTGALLGGLAWAGVTTRRIASELGGGLRLAAPVLALCFGVTLGMLWLLVG